MASKQGKWTRFVSELARDDSRGRLSIEGRYVDLVASPSGRYIAYASVLLPTEPKQVQPVRAIRVYELDDVSVARLSHEVIEAGDALAVADDGSVAFRTASGTILVRPDGTRREFLGASMPIIDGAGALVLQTHGAPPQLVRYDISSGAELRRDAFEGGNIPLVRLAGGDLLGFGGWISPDGGVTPLAREWATPMVSGDAVILSYPLGAEAGETVRIDRGGGVTRLDDCVCAASADGRHVIAVSLPPIEEAHARGMSQYEARIIELVDLGTGERKPLTQALTSVRFPDVKVIAWTASGMIVASNGTVLRYDPKTDEILGRPLTTRAMVLDGDVAFSAHEDGLRARGPSVDAFTALDPQFLVPSPARTRFLTGHVSNHAVVDRALAVKDLGRAARMIFAGEDHVLVMPHTGPSHVLSLESGEQTAVALDGVKSVASLPDGFAAFFDKRIELRAVDGSVRTTWALTKPPKAFKPDGVTAVIPCDGVPSSGSGGALYVVAKDRLFRCDEGRITHLLPTTEKILGGASTAYSGVIRVLAATAERVAIGVFSNADSWFGVLVCTWDDEILGWTGTYTDLPVGLSWSGDDLFVTERSGRTHRVHVPR
jgi:hypothetical protein